MEELVPLLSVNCCSTTAVTRPRTLASGGCLNVTKTDKSMKASAIELKKLCIIGDVKVGRCRDIAEKRYKFGI